MRAQRVVGRWVRLYTRDLPEEIAQRRVEEVEADLHDHLLHERARGTGEGRLALALLSRMVRGLAADVSWRDHQVRANLDHPATRAAAVRTGRRAYRSGLGLALFGVLFLYWIIGALGLIGTDGDRADMMYLAVFGIGILGALAARLRARGMARVLAAMALAQAVIAVIAVVEGRHENPVTSLPELLGLNAMFVALFLTAAWLFRQSARYRPPAPNVPD